MRILRCAVLVVGGLIAVPYGAERLPGRSLTPPEKQALHEVFNGAVNLEPMKLHTSQGASLYLNALGAEAAAFRNTVLASPFLQAGLEKNPDAMYALVHETAHVWQHQNGAYLHLRGAWQTAANFLSLNSKVEQYDYTLQKGKKLSDYNYEQQASIIADYWNIRRGDIPLFLRQYDLDEAERDALYREVLGPLAPVNNTIIVNIKTLPGPG